MEYDPCTSFSQQCHHCITKTPDKKGRDRLHSNFNQISSIWRNITPLSPSCMLYTYIPPKIHIYIHSFACNQLISACSKCKVYKLTNWKESRRINTNTCQWLNIMSSSAHSSSIHYNAIRISNFEKLALWISLTVYTQLKLLSILNTRNHCAMKLGDIMPVNLAKLA